MTEQRRKRTIPRPQSRSGEQSPPYESVSLGQQPEYEIPDLPRDLTIVSDQKLMTLFSEYVTWQNYAATKLAEAEIEETKADAAVRYVEATAMAQAQPSAKVTQTKAKMTAVPEIAKARDRAIDAYATRKMVAVIYANCDRCVALISRELTRRVGREGPERRQNRWNP